MLAFVETCQEFRRCGLTSISAAAALPEGEFVVCDGGLGSLQVIDVSTLGFVRTLYMVVASPGGGGWSLAQRTDGNPEKGSGDDAQ